MSKSLKLRTDLSNDVLDHGLYIIHGGQISKYFYLTGGPLIIYNRMNFALFKVSGKGFVYPCMYLVSEELDAARNVSYENEILEGNGGVDVDVCVYIYEGHPQQVLVVLKLPHEYLQTGRQHTKLTAKC